MRDCSTGAPAVVLRQVRCPQQRVSPVIGQGAGERQRGVQIKNERLSALLLCHQQHMIVPAHNFSKAGSLVPHRHLQRVRASSRLIGCTQAWLWVRRCRLTILCEFEMKIMARRQAGSCATSCCASHHTFSSHQHAV